ncbi:hypothetical protein D5R40_31965 [Okeania hirsuta]|uniref:histidine kinase n=1 Tax=Okeania hirsuta TaxID=1458930 RepID=A0A3N6R333_9CYAN|nr:sensor histidine kinase [Okeania hirsuta]RQH20531.1 hypothetical protein D5R40_31965 [Okeania hirsuta]
MDFLKLRNFDIELLRKPINLRVLADIILQKMLPWLKAKILSLINKIPTNLAAIEGDENRLQQVLYNLIGNAKKFTEKGHIKLEARETAGRVEVKIEDTGIGIPVDKTGDYFPRIPTRRWVDF